MKTADTAFLDKMEAMAARRRDEIRNTADTPDIRGAVYYVSNDGNDDNDGRSPERAWRTLAKVSGAELAAGDGVLFRRGDLFRGYLKAQAGVTYAAWGEGKKPEFYGWDKGLADPGGWILSDPEHHIWKWNERILDAGTLVFNHGQAHSIKLIPSYIGGRFVCRDDESRPFDMASEMVRDLDLYWHFDENLTTNPTRGQDFPIPVVEDSLGELYLRCDGGNPGEIFDSIEALTRRPLIRVGSCADVRIDNLCLKYIGLHAIAAYGACVRGLHVSNCEIGWIGGTIQHYGGTDPNYPEGGRGTVTRFGNGIEIYGGCEDYTVENCYIYQCYDAGITHQVTVSGKPLTMKNVLYRDNLVEACVYSIEYFLDTPEDDTESCMDGIEMCGNILRHSGYGWGQQRHNTHTPAHIKGWSYPNKAKNYTVHDNIFDRAAYRMLHLVAKDAASCPVMQGNTYIQHEGGRIGQYGGNREVEPENYLFDEHAGETIVKVFGDTDAAVYIIR